MYRQVIERLRELRDKVSVAYGFNGEYWLYASFILFLLWYTYMERPA